MFMYYDNHVSVAWYISVIIIIYYLLLFIIMMSLQKFNMHLK